MSKFTKKLADALIALGGLVLVVYFGFLFIECVTFLWNQNDFLMSCGF